MLILKVRFMKYPVFYLAMSLLPGLASAQTSGFEPIIGDYTYTGINPSGWCLRFIEPLDPAYFGAKEVIDENMQAEVKYGALVAEDTRNPFDWMQFYRAVKFKSAGFGNPGDFQTQLDSIDARMLRYVPGTWQQLLVHYWNGNHDQSRSADLVRAYGLQPGNVDIIRQYIAWLMIRGETGRAAEMTSNWEATGVMPRSLAPYAFNVLQSLPQHAVLLTNGEFDTFSINYLQLKSGFRKDVQLVCLALCSRPENRGLIFRNLKLELPGHDSISGFDAAYIRRIEAANPGRKIYLASTLGAEILGALSEDLYLTGLAFRLRTGGTVDNFPFMANNVANKMKLDYLNDYTSENFGFTNAFDNFRCKFLHMNYVLPLIQTAEYYETIGDEARAGAMRTLARNLASAAGKTNEVEPLIAN
jgi:hypothetical protein